MNKTRAMTLWRTIPCTKTDVDLETLLTCGQSFSWRKTADNIWTNVLKGRLFSLTQTDEGLKFHNHLVNESLSDIAPLKSEAVKIKSEDTNYAIVKTESKKTRKRAVKDDSNTTTSTSQPLIKSIKTENVFSTSATVTVCQSITLQESSQNDDESVLRDYFALDIDLEKYYQQWSSSDPHFAKISQAFHGIRILQQDPVENLFSFICSSNNHISRIGSMVLKLRESFGTKVGQVEGIDFYSFPTPEQLCVPGVEVKLRELGFGYRAKYIAKTAQIVHKERPAGWLDSLKKLPYKECIAELMQLCGVGRKVADCIALMSLNKSEVVPVDTHVLQIAVRDYRIPGLSKDVKSLTPAIHDKIGQYFIDLYGEYAGWAHTVLFAADLRQFSDRNATKKKPAAKERKK